MPAANYQRHVFLAGLGIPEEVAIREKIVGVVFNQLICTVDRKISLYILCFIVRVYVWNFIQLSHAVQSLMFAVSDTVVSVASGNISQLCNLQMQFLCPEQFHAQCLQFSQFLFLLFIGTMDDPQERICL